MQKMNNQQYITYTDKSIAVLPFVNMSADPDNEYFSDGITEEIINALTTVKGLKVIARTSSFAFKNKNVDVRTIGSQLGVSTILEGSVRKVKNRIRITAQLISTNDGTHFWSKNFDRELKDIFALQDEISLLIADQIRENFGHLNIKDHLVEVPTQNMEAYNLYLKGRYHQLKWNAEDLLKGVAYYEQSIAEDPTFDLPYFGAGLSHGINASWGFIPYQEGIQRADELLKKGLKINRQHYLGYFGRATISFWGKWDFKKGHKFLLQAIKLNPAFTDAEEGLAELYTAIGAFEKAMYHTQAILTLNPLLWPPIIITQKETSIISLKIRKGQFINFKHDPFLVPLHSNRRFQNLISTVFHPSKLPDLAVKEVVETDSTKAIMPEKDVEQYLIIISDLFEEERLFLDPDLCLKLLAEKISLHPNKLSWLLNEHIGKNFNEYINTFRLEAFKTKALDPSNSHLTILGLAYESGFNSKTVFNAFFKKMEGMTPKAWLKSNKR
jgi:TolB-like protein/AraC-like DNA-binding protein